jgi:hypothetical protein
MRGARLWSTRGGHVMKADPLETLLVDEETIAREELAELLAPYVGITKAGGLVLTDNVTSLKAADRLIAVLLGAWAANLLGLRPRAGATPGELVALSGLPAGTVRPKLSELTKRCLVAKQGSEYVVPLASVRLAAAVLEGARSGLTRRRVR